jgi:hypothetical protein
MEQDCDAPRYDFPAYEGFPVTECSYRQLGRDARVLMMNPDAQQLAKWTVNACRLIAETKLRSCIDRTAARIWSQSNGQFPVAGIVVEPASVLDGDPNKPINFEFRDGVTVRTNLNLNRTERQLTDQEIEGSMVATVLDSKVYARIIGATREQYVAAGGSIDVGSSQPPSARKLKWLDAVRAAHQEAWNGDRHLLIDAWVRWADTSGEF